MAMICGPAETSSFTASDGMRLHTLCWRAEGGGVPRATILFLHGMGEHAGCHVDWLSRFAAVGCDVVAPDLRGHGHSPGRPGAVASYARMQHDVLELAAQSRRESAAPVVIYGHSMGGNLALAALCKDPVAADRVIGSSPWLRLANRPAAIKRLLGTLLVRIAPTLTLATGLSDDQIARPPDVAGRYHADPLTHRRISLGIYYGAMQAAKEMCRDGVPGSAPVLLLHGDQDHVTSVSGSRQLAARCGPRVELRVWPDGPHDLHYSAMADDLFSAINAWLPR